MRRVGEVLVQVLVLALLMGATSCALSSAYTCGLTLGGMAWAAAGVAGLATLWFAARAIVAVRSG